MAEKADSLVIKRDKAKQHLKEVIENSDEARARRDFEELEKQIREKEARKIRKLLVKMDSEIRRANNAHDKVVKDGKRIMAESAGYERRILGAKAEVQRVVTEEMRLQAKLRKIEEGDEPEEMSWRNIMREGRTSDKYEDKSQVVEEK